MLAWAIGNVVGRYDARSNVYPHKARLENKIDPAVALITTIGRLGPGRGEPVRRWQRAAGDLMGLWSRLAGLFGKSADAVGAEFAGDTEGFGYSDGGMPVNSFSTMGHVAVMACVSILAEDLAKIPLGIYRRLGNGGQEPARDHYLHRLLREPNDWQTDFEFKEMMQAALVLRGNAYAVTVRDNRGQPLYLAPVHPDRVASRPTWPGWTGNPRPPRLRPRRRAATPPARPRQAATATRTGFRLTTLRPGV